MTRTRTSLAVAVATLFAAALVILPATSASAATVTTTIAGVTYEGDDTAVAAGATVTAYSGAATSIAIPSTVTIGANIYTVVAIGNGAFDTDPGGHNSGSQLTSVTLPSTLVSIADNGFARNNLTSVTIPNSVTSLGGGAFFDNAIASLTIGSGITAIPAAGFTTNALTSLVIPNTVTSIGGDAFSGNPLLTSVTFGNSLSFIDHDAFTNSPFTTLTFPASVTSIGTHAFNGTNTLTDVRFNGNAPAVPGGEPFYDPALPSAPTVHFLWRNTGFTTPTWQGYPSVAIALVEFNGNGGSAPATEEVEVGDTATDPGASSRPGRVFSGWFTAATGGTRYNFSSAVAGDVLLFAQFEALAATGTDINPVYPIGAGALVLGGIALAVFGRRRAAAHRR